MQRKHVTGIALLLALAVVAGMLAVVRTTGLASNGSRSATDALVQARTAQLDQVEAKLRGQIAAIDTTPTVASTSTGAPAEKVVYVRPAPIVRTVPRSHKGDDGSSERADD